MDFLKGLFIVGSALAVICIAAKIAELIIYPVLILAAIAAVIALVVRIFS